MSGIFIHISDVEINIKIIIGIKVTNGKLQFDNIESMFIQFPTPLLCISKTDFLLPNQEPLANATPSSSEVKTTGFNNLFFCANTMI